MDINPRYDFDFCSLGSQGRLRRIAAWILLSIPIAAINPKIALSAAATTDAAFGKWAASKDECKNPDGEGNTVTISEREIIGLEWRCYIEEAKKENHIVIVKANCGAEGEEFRTTIQYELSGLLLRFRFGTKIEQMLMSCR